MNHERFYMSHCSSFPGYRSRRLRKAPWIRQLVAETCLTVKDLVLPLFVRDGSIPSSIPSMPGVRRYTLQELPDLMEHVQKAGIPAVALFPVVPLDHKSPNASEALQSDALLLKAITVIKKHAPHVGLITDAALDAYTSHGHDGLLNDDGHVDNDKTIDVLAKHALVQAQAGVDIIAPSDMMDGRIQAIRTLLDREGYSHVSLLSYTAKYVSALYDPFRDALQSSACLGKGAKHTYHMHSRNSHEALREAAQDIQENADMLMVKPGTLYLDILWRISTTFNMPTFAYHVSGEYAMLKAASHQGWIDYDRALIESLIAFKRAGACGIFTYGAFEAAALLKEGFYEI